MFLGFFRRNLKSAKNTTRPLTVWIVRTVGFNRLQTLLKGVDKADFMCSDKVEMLSALGSEAGRG